MNNTDKQLLRIYTQAFVDELNSRYDEHDREGLSLKSYQLGGSDALLGDELSSVDAMSDEEVLKRIRTPIYPTYEKYKNSDIAKITRKLTEDLKIIKDGESTE